MKSIDWKRGVLVTSLGVGLAWFAGGTTWTRAQEGPRPPMAREDADRAVEQRSGEVEKLLRNDHDDLDGMVLKGGQVIHFPPHMGAAISKLVQVGDKVEIEGQVETLPRGEVVLEASRIESRGQAVIIERPRPPYGPRSPKGPRRAREMEEPMNAKGTIKEFATNRHGDVDGLLLADGTAVKLPPHQGRELQDLVREGDEVRVEGRRHETPHGEIHLHADRITAVASGKSLEREGPRGPGRERPVPPHERGRGDRDEGPGARRGPPPHVAQFDEILRELREVRRLLEAQQKN